MNDNQRTVVLTSLTSVAQEPLLENADRLLVRMCEYAGLKQPIIEYGSKLSVSRKRVQLPDTASTMTVLHAVAHLATPAVFPAHGAEFCDQLLILARRFTPWTEALLEQEFARRGVHYTAQHRQKAVFKAILQREVDGTEIVEAALADPPELIVGGPVTLDRDAKIVTIGASSVPLSRFRYLAKVK